MSQSQSTTYICDLCGAKGNPGLPTGWKHIRPYDLCPKCVQAIVNSLTLKEAEQLVKDKTPAVYMSAF